MSDGGVTRCEESLGDGVTELGAFSDDGVDVDREVGGEDVKDHPRGNGGNVRVDRRDGSTKGQPSCGGTQRCWRERRERRWRGRKGQNQG